MKLIADLHTHTLVSSHAYSTLHEMVTRARSLGLLAMAVTDHGVAMPDAPHPWYFHTLVRQPALIEDEFLLLKGVEANAVQTDGELDMPEQTMRGLDWVIVSLHQRCLPYTDPRAITDLWLRVAENPLVDMIGHPEQRQYDFDYDRVTQAFAAYGKVVELNANSPVSRPGNEQNTRELLLACKRNSTRIAVNSDAHSLFEMGNTGWCLELLRELAFPEELVVNASMRALARELERHGRPVAELAWQLAEKENE